ncbi:MAG: PEGA domain-containing protein [Thermoplasmata archaeon]|nr:PEGA domain-containing protein [Thermoplasmata archaeon]
MEKSSIGVNVALILMTIGLLGAPVHVGLSPGKSVTLLGPVGHSTHTLVPAAVGRSVPTPLTTYPRTVLVETFTGVWCIHCPAESQALFNIDRNTSHTVLDIAELHHCISPPSNCMENYAPPDGTEVTRGTFYNVCGYPDVFFDGRNDACGATNSAPQMASEYNSRIANASAIPGTVSISQTAWVSPGGVTAFANVTSAVSGTYNAVSYLLEFINKQNVSNGYGPHDVASVVRATLVNHPVNLTAGATTEVSTTHSLLPAWNVQNLSVVTFIQQNSTKIVQNANLATVSTMTAGVTLSKSTIVSGASSTVTVRVLNSTTGTVIVGAAVDLTSNGVGSFSPSSGVTDSTGTFTAKFTAPTVSSAQTVPIMAHVSAAGYGSGDATTALIVNPIVTPDAVTGVTLAPGNLQVGLNWTQPASGGAGLSYHVFRSTSQGGTYTQVGVSSSTGFLDTGLIGGLSYWYMVGAQNTAGFSPNSTPASAEGVTAIPLGLTQNVGWWISIDSATFTSATNASLSLYVPSGVYTYDFGAKSFSFLAAQVTGPLDASNAAISIFVSFSPRYATLQGTVNPSGATVTANGAPVSVVHGSFDDPLVAGVYALVVSAPGYVANATSVTLTPGNATTVNVVLVQSPQGSPFVGLGGLTGVAIIAVAAVVGVAGIIGGASVMSKKKHGLPPQSEQK